MDAIQETLWVDQSIKRKVVPVDKTGILITRIHGLAEELNGVMYKTPRKARVRVHSPVDAYNIIGPILGGLDREELWVLALDVRNGIMQLVKIYQGSVNSTQIRTAELFRWAVANNASSIIVVHNHPSGDPSASPDDLIFTRNLISAGKILDIDVVDHLIIGENCYVSLKEKTSVFSN